MTASLDLTLLMRNGIITSNFCMVLPRETGDERLMGRFSLTGGTALRVRSLLDERGLS